MRDGGWTVPITVVPNAVAARRDPERSDEGFFLVASRLSPEKGVDIAARAARAAQVTLVVLGDGPERERLLAEFPGLDIRGQVSADEVERQQLRCRAAVVSSTAIENAPMSVLEAMNLGVPVISSSVGGVPEQVRDLRDGILVPPGDVEALAAALRQLANDAGLAARMGQSARHRAQTEFSFDRHMRSLIDVYERELRLKEARDEKTRGSE
jgi:glycosyltransferase involved in cell wall biosynthesis